MISPLFIAHGAPLLAIEDNEYTQFLNHLGETMPRPKAVVVFSAHWESARQQISDVDTYDTIYDFGGFPDELYHIEYPAKGDHAVASEIEAAFTRNGIAWDVNTDRGLDHGAWIVLRLLFAQADVPVVAMSVNPRITPQEQYQIGKSLAALSEQDVLVVASGGTVHNLRAVDFRASEPNDWAVRFDAWLAEHLREWDVESLFAYAEIAPDARLAVPPHGNEHFIALFYAMGAADGVRRANLLHRSYRYGNLSHSVWQFG